MESFKRHEKLIILNRTMAYLGFQKQLDHYSSTEDSLPHRIEYADVPGNTVSFDFQLEPTGTIISRICFNGTTSRTWNDFKSLVDEIPTTVESWLTVENKPKILGHSMVRKSANRSLRAKDILSDLKDGMDDDSIMAKYGLTPRGVANLLDKLVWEGLLTEEDLEKRKAMGATVTLPLYKCIVCSELQFARLSKCPHCGGKMSPVDTAD